MIGDERTDRSRRRDGGGAGEPLGIDRRALDDYLDAVAPTLGPASRRRVTLLAGGRSNLTYLIEGGDRRLVLRRPPFGTLAPTAHDMGREFLIQRALAEVGYPVARPVAFSDDPAITGTDFYLMEFVEGFVLDDVTQVPPLTPEIARTLSVRLMDSLAELHAVDLEAAGLGDLGRADGYLERQVARWTSRWDSSRTRDLPIVEDIARRLRQGRPSPTTMPAIVHGDFRLGNMILGPGPRHRVEAVLDWELSTLGDPLADLGFTLAHWREAGGPLLAGSPDHVVPHAGFLTRHEMAERYLRVSGRDVGDIDYYVVLACFKTAVIFEEISARHRANDGPGDDADDALARADAFFARAADIASRSSIPALSGPLRSTTHHPETSA